jgi:hypothetical protein
LLAAYLVRLGDAARNAPAAARTAARVRREP